ncbi:MAG: type pilus assembly protein PilO [Acidobacteriota bacterium]|jgi:Tfp pilus assembly protein PilO|nr:type pilus assembly protein PilO [Acidobacteriota bacterium]
MKIGNLQELPWYYRLAIFGGIAIAVYVGFWYFMTSGMHDEVNALKDEVASLKQQNMSAQIDSQRLANFKALYQSKQQEYEDLKSLLPEQRELTNVLQGIQDRASSSRLVLRSFSPKEDFQQDFYNGKKISVGVTSSYASLREFFELMARYQRIVSITNFEITQLPKQSQGKTIDAKFELTAYYVSAESLQRATPPSAPPAPNGAAPQPAGAPQIKIPAPAPAQ